MTNLSGVKICGKRGGKPFKEALRPTLIDRACPEGTTPCSSATTIENTICISREDKDAGLCPITEIKLMDNSRAI